MDDASASALNPAIPWVVAVQEIRAMTRTLTDQWQMRSLPTEGLACELRVAVADLSTLVAAVDADLGI